MQSDGSSLRVKSCVAAPSEKYPGPRRIVSLAPSATSILLAIGAGRELIGVSRWCKDVVNVGKRPQIGDCWAVDTREIERLRPTLLIGSVPFKAEAVQKLLALPAAFVALNPRTIADVYRDIELLGRLTGRVSSAKEVVQEMRREFAKIARRAAALTPRLGNDKSGPRVYAEAWPNPRISSPPWVAEMIQIAGGQMVVPAGQKVSDEHVRRAQPDVILLAWTATGDRAKPETALNNKSWKNIPAVKNRKIFVLRDELVNTPGPPLVEGAWKIFGALHPEHAVSKP